MADYMQILDSWNRKLCTKSRRPKKDHFPKMQLHTQYLVLQFTENKTPLQSKHSSAVTNQKKAKVWAGTTDALTAMGNVPHTMDSVKKRCLELKHNGVALSSTRKQPSFPPLLCMQD